MNHTIAFIADVLARVRVRGGRMSPEMFPFFVAVAFWIIATKVGTQQPWLLGLFSLAVSGLAWGISGSPTTAALVSLGVTLVAFVYWCVRESLQKTDQNRPKDSDR